MIGPPPLSKAFLPPRVSTSPSDSHCNHLESRLSRSRSKGIKGRNSDITLAMASPNGTLPGDERPGTSSIASYSLDPEKERRNPMLGDDSTSTPVPSKNDKTKDVEPLAQDASEYPQGTSLVFIVVALALSIFLASLDMVGVFDYSVNSLTLTLPDHCRHGNTQDHRRVPRSR